jgi:hypothetical protein
MNYIFVNEQVTPLLDRLDSSEPLSDERTDALLELTYTMHTFVAQSKEDGVYRILSPRVAARLCRLLVQDEPPKFQRWFYWTIFKGVVKQFPRLFRR